MRGRRGKLIAIAFILFVLGCAASSMLGDNLVWNERYNAMTSESIRKPNHNQPIKMKFGIWESKTDIEFWTKKVKQYSLIKPNVTVEVETIPDNSGQYLKVRLAANDLPDLFYLKSGHLPIYKEAVLPLNDLNATQRNKFPATMDGDVIGLPLVSYSEYVYYHPSIFEEVGVEIPRTLDEFMDVLERIKAYGKYVPIAIGGKDEWTFYPFMEFGPAVLARDVNYLSRIAGMEKPFGAGSTFERSATLLREISENELAGPEALSIGYDQATQLFQSGQAAMIALGQWYYSEHQSKVNYDDDLDAFAFPWRESVTEQIYSATMQDHYMAINKNTKHTDEAIAFLEWVFSPEVYQTYINNTQNTSTLIDVDSTLPFFAQAKSKHPFVPFLYNGLDEKFVRIKNAAQYDEKKSGQELFAGAKVSDIQNRLNDNWTKAVQSIDDAGGELDGEIPSSHR
ncbi:extracellular solute-binding protein [Paenibacillus sp. LHD-117]|uniref:ABC transporter substrate-binding protein n=1 Tax=Paenibacillus sp. LHD-117 TaxID=3071412 RepID=UPI0027E09AB3|nr:extracellular solute-binding protein [Paenibacillus sp. LHD-117]MDQ6422155.1 extracellular solute-binding protein [Paenibacillus sp. LHD-117]